jgi:tetratricopeptide (TPR) repeat protein
MNELQNRFAEVESDINDKNQYSMAISKLEKIILTDPNNSEANDLMGLAYHREGKEEVAIYYFIKSLIADPQNSSPARLFEYCLIRCSVNPDVEKLAQCLEMLPNSGDFSYFRGLIFYYTGKYESAIIEYSKAFENNLKKAFENNPKYESEILEYSKAFEKDLKKSFEKELKWAFENNPKYESEIIECSKAFKNNLINADLYYKIAKCYNKMGQCDKAVDEYQKYLKIYNGVGDSGIFIEIAFMFIKNNRFNDALIFFNEFVNTAYRKPENDMGMLCLPFDRENFHEPDKICAGVLNSAPENWSAFACKVILELIAVNIKEK